MSQSTLGPGERVQSGALSPADSLTLGLAHQRSVGAGVLDEFHLQLVAVLFGGRRAWR
jgi:hypothetical protein